MYVSEVRVSRGRVVKDGPVIIQKRSSISGKGIAEFEHTNPHTSHLLGTHI